MLGRNRLIGYGVKDDLHFCEWLAGHVGVGAVPGSCFFREDVLLRVPNRRYVVLLLPITLVRPLTGSSLTAAVAMCLWPVGYVI